MRGVLATELTAAPFRPRRPPLPPAEAVTENTTAHNCKRFGPRELCPHPYDWKTPHKNASKQEAADGQAETRQLACATACKNRLLMTPVNPRINTNCYCPFCKQSTHAHGASRGQQPCSAAQRRTAAPAFMFLARLVTPVARNCTAGGGTLPCATRSVSRAAAAATVATATP